MANQPHTLFVSPLLDVKQRRRAEAVMGDIFTSCQGAIFLLKEQNSFLIQSRSLGVDKVDTLLKYSASDKTNRSFTWEQSSQKDYSTFILGRLYSVKHRSRIMSCDCKPYTGERCSDVSFQSRERELEEYLSSVLSGRNLFPPAASSSPCSRYRPGLAGSAPVSRPPEKGKSPL